MNIKGEAEEKLLKIYYDVKLDRYFKKKPTRAKIEAFEETKDPDDFDHFYGIKEEELIIGMWADTYENGIAYIAVQMAFDSAKMWREDFYCKHINLFSCFYLIIPLMMILLGRLSKVNSPITAILINIIGDGILVFFFVATYKWKKRLLIRFKDFFKDTGISVPEKTFKNYSKSPMSGFYISYLFQGFIVLLIFLSWVFVFSTEI